MENIVKDAICNNLGIDKYKVIIEKRGNKPSICFIQLLDALFEHKTGAKAIKSLGRSEQTFNRLVKKLFPEVSLQGGSETWLFWLVYKSGYKKCNGCNSFKPHTEFSTLKSSKLDKLDHECKQCKTINNKDSYNYYIDYHKNYWKIHGAAKSAKRRADLINATPKWANLAKIKEIYLKCPEGYHVDHIFPLRGINSCGLHVENNLQYLLAEDNLKKGNRI